MRCSIALYDALYDASYYEPYDHLRFWFVFSKTFYYKTQAIVASFPQWVDGVLMMKLIS